MPQWTPASLPGPPHSDPSWPTMPTGPRKSAQVVPEVMHAMEDAGLFEVIVPERLGGLGPLHGDPALRGGRARAGVCVLGVVYSLNITTWAASQANAAEELFDGAERPRLAAC